MVAFSPILSVQLPESYSFLGFNYLYIYLLYYYLLFNLPLLNITFPVEDDSDDSDDEMPQLEGADSGPTPGVMTDEQMSKAKQTRYFGQIDLYAVSDE